MMSFVSSCLALPGLAAQWKLFALGLVAFARIVARRCEAGTHDAYARADALELAARCALAALTRQIQGAQDSADTAPSPETQDALDQMVAAAATLMVLAAFAQSLKLRLAGRGWPNWRGTFLPALAAPGAPGTLAAAARPASARPAAAICGPGYLDSS